MELNYDHIFLPDIYAGIEEIVGRGITENGANEENLTVFWRENEKFEMI